jgi:V-type H+-transporting ATPase S1 subunit
MSSYLQVFVLTGPVEQQDVEISALYRDAQVNYGQKNILGILATRHEHSIYKRQATSESTTTEIPSTTPSGDEPVVENLVYEAKNKGLLYTTEVPILTIRGNKSSEDVTYSLDKHAIVTADERGDVFRLSIKFIVPDNNVILIRLVFQQSVGWWGLYQAEVEYFGKQKTLDIIGSAPSAPFGFSYACRGSFLFHNEGMSLIFKNIQVQPLLKGVSKFSKPYDCVGVTTPAILSGTFIVFILSIALTIGITAILDIKTPNKFENRSSKQLTFTVQE